MHGGPSHVDLLDPKPLLEKYDGKPPPAEVADDEKLTGNLLKSPYQFSTSTANRGLEFSETLPHIAGTPTRSPSSARCSPSIAITSRPCG